MIKKKETPRCCPTKKYVLLGLHILGNDAIWEIHECKGCGHLVRKFLIYFQEIDEVRGNGKEIKRNKEIV